VIPNLDDGDFLAAFRREADALAAAAAGNLDAPIPAVGDWTVRDVVEHMADGNRWVILIIRDGRAPREGRRRGVDGVDDRHHRRARSRPDRHRARPAGLDVAGS
jgi:hypothetical protein